MLIFFSTITFEIFVLDNHCAHMTLLQMKDQTTNLNRHDLGANKKLYQIQPKNYYVLVTLIQQKLLISLSQTSISLRIIFKDFQKTWHEQRNNGQDWNVALYVNFQFLPILHTQNLQYLRAMVKRRAEWALAYPSPSWFVRAQVNHLY